MRKTFRRRNYFVDPSIQLKYIAFSILPALVMTLFCTYFLNVSGERILGIQTDTVFAELSTIKKTLRRVEDVSAKDIEDNVTVLKDVLGSFEGTMLSAYSEGAERWNQAKLLVLISLFSVLAGTTMLALLYSHRIAGPLFRIRRCINSLSEGKDIEPIRLRKNDEFKELAQSLDKLRTSLKDRGFLQSQD
jgi:nitrogen fixation/metabolism regulation signal transduction histidine kinase